jgi:hypothetical protein
MITGYFLIDKHGILSPEKIKRSLLKILKVTVVANIVYLLFNIAKDSIHDPQSLVDTIFMSPKTILKLIFVGNVFGGHLWYLTALLEALVFFYFCSISRLEKYIPVVAICGLILIFALNEFRILGYDIDDKHIYIYRNFFTIAIPFMYIGMLIRVNEHKINCSIKTLVYAIMCVIVLTYAEYALLGRGYVVELMLMSVPLIVFSFILALKIKLSNNWFSKLGRDHSSFVYIYHVLVLSLCRFVKLDIPIISTIETFCVTIGLSYITRYLKRICNRK